MHEYEALYHPGLVHFGIGLVLFGWVVYVFTIFFKRYDASFQKFATWLLLLGGLGTFLALMTGMLFVGHYSGLPREMQDIHMDLAHLTFFSIFITCVIKLVAIVRYIKYCSTILANIYILYILSLLDWFDRLCRWKSCLWRTVIDKIRLNSYSLWLVLSHQ